MMQTDYPYDQLEESLPPERAVATRKGIVWRAMIPRLKWKTGFLTR